MDVANIALLSWAKKWLKQPKKQYINGKWLAGNSAEYCVVKNPANGKDLCQFSVADVEQIELVAQIANTIHQKKTWSKVSRTQRAEKLRKIAQLIRDYTEELAILETLANGKLYRESLKGDIPTCADIFDYYASWADKYYGETLPLDDGFINYTLKEPIGVCALMVSWDFPLYQASLKIAPALAMGNPVIIKPSEYTPLTILFLIELIDQKLNFPKGVINLLLTTDKAAAQLTLSHNVHKVSFTGTTEASKSIAKNASVSNLKSTSLEIGSKSPCIFFEDTPNLDTAIDRAFNAMFSHKGEKYAEPSRFLIHDRIYDYVIERLVKKANSIKCGDPFDKTVTQGPQCNQHQYSKILEYINIGVTEATLVAGGYADTEGENANGFFIRPTIFADVKSGSRIVKDEIFGPILCCSRFTTTQEAVDMANSTTHALAAGIYTSNVARAYQVAEDIDADIFFINKYDGYGLCSAFGDFKMGDSSREVAIDSLSSFTKNKSIWVALGKIN